MSRASRISAARYRRIVMASQVACPYRYRRCAMPLGEQPLCIRHRGLALWVKLVASMDPDELADFETRTFRQWDRTSLGDLPRAIERRRRELGATRPTPNCVTGCLAYHLAAGETGRLTT